MMYRVEHCGGPPFVFLSLPLALTRKASGVHQLLNA